MIKIRTKYLACLRLPLLFIIISLLMLSMARLGFIAWQWQRIDAQDHLWFTIIQGVRFDLVVVSGLLLIPAFLTPIATMLSRFWLVWQKGLIVYLTGCFIFLLYMEMATPSFMAQFDLRPNILFVEYLKYPKEVISMLWGAYKLPIVLAAIIIPVCTRLFYRYLKRHCSPVNNSWLTAVPLSIIVLLLSVLGVRSTLGHRPVNPSIVAATNDLMVNDLALNSSYTMLYAIYESRRDEKGEAVYGELPRHEIIGAIKAEMFIADSDFTNPDIPTLHRQKAMQSVKQPLNLVIILEESLGAEFVGSLGGKPLTPNIDRLAHEGIWFERLYATGTRSVRGIEAVITGFTPTPARSVVKLNRSQHNFFTFAQLLQEQGYETSFIYGGESHFDNMRRFFVANGFNKIIDEKDFRDPVFTGSWGVSDEDLFNKAHEEFEKKHDKPFFSLVFSSSNHSPFEYPDNRIELYDEEKATENNAVKYADYAVGEFIEKAKQSSYWNNTLFLIVADHNSRVRGASLVPIDYFHIPGLVLGADIQPRRIKRIASQIDLMPTLLSIMGINSEHPAVGLDLLRSDLADHPGRAMMQYNATQAYMEDKKVVIFQRNKKPGQYQYEDNKLTKMADDPQLVHKALAHSLWGPMSYRNSLYRLP